MAEAFTSGYDRVLEGVFPEVRRSKLKFLGGVTIVDDPTIGATVVTITGGGGGAPVSEEPSGTRPGTSFTTANTFVTINVFVNGIRQKPVGGSPLVGEFTYTGTTLTTGSTIFSTDWLLAEGTV